MAQRSEDGVGKTRETSKRLERAIPVWTRSAISIQASSRDDGCINRPDTRKHLNLCDQIFRIPPCIRWGVHTRHRATLWGVYIRPELRRTGAAEALVRATVALVQPPVEDVLLTVSLHNVGAVKLYERLGFEPYAVKEHALKLADGTYVDEMLMRLRVMR